MASITLKNVKKQFDKDIVIKDLNLEIKEGSFTVLVGPSGCGKSTTLRMIAGLEKVSEGDIYIDDKKVTDVSPGKREIAMVFQNYALYPTMTVKENIEFGLKNKKVNKSDREKLIKEICEIVELTECLDRKPGNLSGGQRQRVALARAMVKKPKVFLMDEPLSNLDAKLRNQMRAELVQLHKRLGTTFVYVTHDQVEAMSMGDEIVVMHEGEIMQVANPVNLYRNPENLFTAQFIGAPPMNIIDIKHKTDNLDKIGFRPEKGTISKEKIKGKFWIQGEINTREILGAETIYHIQTELGTIHVKAYNEVLDEDIAVIVNVDFIDVYFFNSDGNIVSTNDENINILKKNHSIFDCGEGGSHND